MFTRITAEDEVEAKAAEIMVVFVVVIFLLFNEQGNWPDAAVKIYTPGCVILWTMNAKQHFNVNIYSLSDLINKRRWG